VVNTPFAYNVILVRKTLNAIGAIIAPAFLKMKFPTSYGIGEEYGHQLMARTYYAMSIKNKSSISRKDKASVTSKEAYEIRSGKEISLEPKDSAESKGTIEPDDEVEELVIAEGKKLNVGKALIGQVREELTQFLIKNFDMFAWSASDMPGIDRQIAEHKLYIKLGFKPVR
jgi:hypothetical protein